MAPLSSCPGRSGTRRPRTTTSVRDSFTYKVCDNGTTNGAADPKCDTATVHVTVTPVNDPPKANADSASVAEDSSTGVLVDVKATDSAGPANESGQTLTFTARHRNASARLGRRSRLRRCATSPTAADYFGSDDVHLHGPGHRADRRSAASTTSRATPRPSRVTVTEVNDPPVGATRTRRSVAEDNSTGRARRRPRQ